MTTMTIETPEPREGLKRIQALVEVLEIHGRIRMSINCRRLFPRALVVLGLLFGVSLATPPSHAGQAVILAPDDDRAGPEGSQIPQVRIEETEEKVRDYKEKMRQTSPVQQREQLPKDESPKPKVEQPQ